jgi:hypothetical protein
VLGLVEQALEPGERIAAGLFIGVLARQRTAEATVQLRIWQKGLEYIDQSPFADLEARREATQLLVARLATLSSIRNAPTGAASPSSAPVTNRSRGHGRHQRSAQPRPLPRSTRATGLRGVIEHL